MQDFTLGDLVQMFIADILKIELECSYANLIRVDYSDYVVVDGEEGDYGRVKYYLEEILLLDKHVMGGDDELLNWTKNGKELLTPLVLNSIANYIKQILKD